MTLLAGVLNGNNNNSDFQFQAGISSLIGQGVISGFLVTAGQLSAGSALISVTRGVDTFLVPVRSDTVITIDTTGTKKYWLTIAAGKVTDNSAGLEAGSDICTVGTGASYPVSGFWIPLCSITGGVITDARTLLRPLDTIGATLPLASVVNLGLAGGKTVHIGAGTGPITSFGSQAKVGEKFTLIFDVAATITYNAVSMILPRAQNLSVLAGDVLEFQQDSLGNFRLTGYALTSGLPIYVAPVSVATPLLIDTSFPAGEPLVAELDGVFIENVGLFAGATISQNVGDVAANTRISFPVFGSGVAGTTLKLALAKVVSPSINLNIRIETDNGSGDPSGSLFHANAIATIAPGSLTTTLADTTLTLAGSITIPAGQKCHVVVLVGTYGAETINGTNYYVIGLESKNTTTRFGKLWNGSAWGVGAPLVEATTNSYSATSNTDSKGIKFTANKNCVLRSVALYGSSGSNRCHLLNSAGTVLATATSVSSFVATFSPYLLVAGTTYRIEFDASGGSHTWGYTNSPIYTANTHITYVVGSSNGADAVGQSFEIVSITTVPVLGSDNFFYSNSSLFTPAVLSKCDANYSYKIAFWGISTETVAIGAFPKIAIGGAADLLDTVHASDYYLGLREANVANSSTIAQATNDSIGSNSAQEWIGQTTYNRQGQSFTTVTDRILRSLTVPLAKQGSPVDTISCTLYAADRTTVIATSPTTFVGSALTTSYVDYTFQFGDIMLQAGTSYFIAITRSGSMDGSNFFLWASKSSGPYAGGQLFYYNSGSWTAQATYDHKFTLQMGSGSISNIALVAGANKKLVGTGVGTEKIELNKFPARDQSVVLFQRNPGGATAVVAVPHGLGRIPTKIEVDAFYVSSSNGNVNAQSKGYWDSVSGIKTIFTGGYNGGASANGNSTSLMVSIGTTSTSQTATITFDAVNVYFSWTGSGAGAGNNIECVMKTS